MQSLGRFFQGARFLGGGRGAWGDLLLCAGAWWPLLSAASSLKMMFMVLFSLHRDL